MTDFAERDAASKRHAALRGGGGALVGKPVSRNAAPTRGRIYGWRSFARASPTPSATPRGAAAHGDARAHHLELRESDPTTE